MAAPDVETQKKVVNRLKRARGQLDGVIAMVEEGRACRDVVTQLAAVSKALDRAGFVVISSAMKDCLEDPDQPLTVEELEKVFLSLS
ncbi:metal-sensitive transcriptional regulator [Actinomycetaceae bacterium WB03_NA08]|uniref:Metal-sensitive transcriptional regulator n=1 Tax=Scrofimicrobium canadense TaxID=2652290 RepID=A0A6N7VT19_9ACTO|nr:metal-sensitive transcriptional regulator [Scrofimicrobium canadense]MSS84090.1 metal-sensitive transcriptional regulator [Scrofimicrobium canadense]